MTTAPAGAGRSPLGRPLPGVHGAVGRFAASPAAPVLAFAWGLAEALAWPVVPEFLVVLLVLTAPRRLLVLATAAALGSVAGGALAYGLDAAGQGDALLSRVPLVTDRMTAEAARALHEHGAGGVFHQPLSGIPFKVFGLQAARAGVGLVPFLLASAVARAARLLAFGALSAAGAALGRRWIPRLFLPLAAVYTVTFAVGLSRVVEAWR